jgi:uncharacterized protein (DUF488 family)
VANIPVYTIGYGNRSISEFVGVLQQYGIQFLVDVRSQPYSRFKPDFSKEQLEKQLKQCGIRYVFMGDTLGGRPDDSTCYVDGKVDYAVLREKAFYQQGIGRVRTAWEKQLHFALMCAEARPEECHRGKLIGNTLMEQHIDVAHIDESGKIKTQDEVNQAVRGGQLSLFDQSLPVTSNDNLRFSRKTYAVPTASVDKETKPKIVTIGVYGFDRESFFQALLDAKVDTFCDIRLNRGMRGSTYAFVNSKSLQQRLQELNIRYLHVKDLAPDKTIREKQQREDKKSGVAKRARKALGQAFIQMYEQDCLSTFCTYRYCLLYYQRISLEKQEQESQL